MGKEAYKTKIDALIESLRQVAGESEEARFDTSIALRDLRRSLATPDDVYDRFEKGNLEICVSRIAQDLEIYQTLASSQEPMSVDALAAKAGAAPKLLHRILRYLASLGQISETGPNTFAANAETRTLATPGFRGLTYHTFHTVHPLLQGVPDFLADRKYRDVTTTTDTATQRVFNTPLPVFTWFPTQPKRFEYLQQFMAVQPYGVPWFSVYPLHTHLGNNDDVFLVDVGGGLGHQCARLIEAYPELKGKLVLQDYQEALDQAPPLEGVEKMAHNFFTKQPVKGAHIYYLRHVLHDWPDEECLVILKHLKDAMGPESLILIDDMVLPDTGVHERAAALDLLLMSSHGAKERTADDWRALTTAAGLRIQSIETYFPRRHSSIIQVGLM
ncbi:hypothetical protein CDD82_1894 [Ophiocordyceps australis]|uniref:Uncharacterized protein n=1 Tax=Ophiocordyceps australis TaxID=1399860 RepID=A0A2C5ZEA1_9HYPO|nr:hypothetical protein CDD82_1894 [Ophiocordyceps australis]